MGYKPFEEPEYFYKTDKKTLEEIRANELKIDETERRNFDNLRKGYTLYREKSQ
jgi:hypothetical protein